MTRSRVLVAGITIVLCVLTTTTALGADNARLTGNGLDTTLADLVQKLRERGAKYKRIDVAYSVYSYKCPVGANSVSESIWRLYSLDTPSAVKSAWVGDFRSDVDFEAEAETIIRTYKPSTQRGDIVRRTHYVGKDFVFYEMDTYDPATANLLLHTLQTIVISALSCACTGRQIDGWSSVTLFCLTRTFSNAQQRFPVILSLGIPLED